MSEQSRIEDDLARTRVRMDARLSELQARFTPGRIADDVMGYLQGSDSGEFVRNLATSAKSHPVPAVISGIGLAWLMAVNGRGHASSHGSRHDDICLSEPSRRRDASQPFTNADDFDRHLDDAHKSVTRLAGESETTYADRLNEAKGKALGVLRDAKDTSSDYAGRVSEAAASTRLSLVKGARHLADGAADTYHSGMDKAQQAGGTLADQARSVGRSGSDMFGTVMESPMILGAIGLGIGALLGALVPRTETETQALGGIAEEARGTFRESSQEVLDRGSDAARDALAAGQSAAQDRGLAGSKSLGDIAKDVGNNKLSGNVADVAKSALAAAGDSLHESGKARS